MGQRSSTSREVTVSQARQKSVCALIGVLALCPVLMGACSGDNTGTLAGDEAGPPSPSQDSRAPNVLLILADDLGWHDTSLGTEQFYQTPNVDQLATRGLRFENAYASSPLCSPTRASILTGQEPARHGVTAPMGHLPEHRTSASLPTEAWPNQRAITPSTATRIAFENETLPEAFRDAGYTTALFGKWHLGGGPHAPTAHGFDTVLGGSPQPGPPSYFAPFGIPNLPEAEDGAYLSDVLVGGVIDWLREERQQPFFACLWFYQVHAPFQGRPDLREEALKRLRPDEQQRSASYAAMVQSMDDGVGRVLAELDALGIRENTIVIFTSDNGGNQYDTIYGDLPGQPGVGIPPTRNAPLRGGKGTIWEGGARVPLIVDWPQAVADGRMEAGATTSALASSADLYPTLLELAGLPARPQQALDGYSFVPVLLGHSGARQEVEIHFPHYFPISGSRPATSIRVGDHKLVRLWADGPGGSNRELLFDLSNDPGEEHDLAPERVERRTQLAQRLDAYLDRTSALLPKPNPAFDPQSERWFAGPGTDLSTRSEDAASVMVVASDQHQPSIAARIGDGIGGHLSLQLDLATTAQGPLTLYWFPQADPSGRTAHSMTVPITSDGAWQTLRFSFEVGGALGGLRLDPITEKGEVRLRAVGLFNVGEDLVRAW